MNFYQLSGKLNIDTNTLLKKYQELFPSVKIYDFTVGLTAKEIEKLIDAFN
jgi:hypothetical protein